MSLGGKVIDELKAGRRGPVEVTDGDVRARVDVVGSGSYGSEVRGVSVERTEPRGAADAHRGARMSGAVKAIGDRVRYLAEPIAPLESDESSGRGILRTERAAVRGREYYEVEVDGGDRIDVGRFRGTDTGGRDRVSENYGHRLLEKLVDDLEEVVRDRRDEVRGD